MKLLTPRGGSKKLRRTFVFKARVLEIGGIYRKGAQVSISVTLPKSKAHMVATPSDTWVHDPGASSAGPWRLQLNPGTASGATDIRVVMTHIDNSRQFEQTPVKFRVVVDGEKFGSMYTDLAQLCLVPDCVIKQDFVLEPRNTLLKLQLMVVEDAKPVPVLPMPPPGGPVGSAPFSGRFKLKRSLSARLRGGGKEKKVNMTVQVLSFTNASGSHPVAVEVYYPPQTLLGSTNTSTPDEEGKCTWDADAGRLVVPVVLGDTKNNLMSLAVVNPTLPVGDIGEVVIDVNSLSTGDGVTPPHEFTIVKANAGGNADEPSPYDRVLVRDTKATLAVAFDLPETGTMPTPRGNRPDPTSNPPNIPKLNQFDARDVAGSELESTRETVF